MKFIMFFLGCLFATIMIMVSLTFIAKNNPIVIKEWFYKEFNLNIEIIKEEQNAGNK